MVTIHQRQHKKSVDKDKRATGPLSSQRLLSFLPAVEDPAKAVMMLQSQWACYRRHGVEIAETMPACWDGTWFVMANHPGRGITGGARLELKLDATQLPVELALSSDRAALKRLRTRARRGLAEVCGLWTDSEETGTGLGATLIEAATALAPYCDANILMSFAHHLNWFTELVGFAPDPALPVYAYPDQRYETRVYWCDPHTLSTACPAAKWEILEMRSSFLRGQNYRWDSESSALRSWHRQRHHLRRNKNVSHRIAKV